MGSGVTGVGGCSQAAGAPSSHVSGVQARRAPGVLARVAGGPGGVVAAGHVRPLRRGPCPPASCSRI